MSIQSRWVSVTVTFIDVFAEKACVCGVDGLWGSLRWLQPPSPQSVAETPLHGHRQAPRQCAQGGARVGSRLRCMSASTAPSAEGLRGNTGPAPFRVGPGGPAQHFLSRATAPPNQRPLRAGSRFKQRLGGFSQVRSVAAAAAAVCGPWSTALWGPGRTGPPSW